MKLRTRMSATFRNYPPSAWFFEILRMAATVLNRRWTKIRVISLYGVRFPFSSVIGKELLLMRPTNILARGRVIVGNRVQLTTELDDGQMTLGSEVEIGNDCRLDFSGGLTLGDATLLSTGVRIYTHSHGLNPKSTPVPMPLDVGDCVWIGAGAIILESVCSIGDDALIGAGSVLTKSVPAGQIWAGNPARYIKDKPHREDFVSSGEENSAAQPRP